MKNRKRWHLLWFVGSVLWLMAFLENVIAGAEIEFSVFMKLLAAVLFFMAGIVGHYRYNKSTGK